VRWQLIDRFLFLKKGCRAEAVKAFRGTEDFFTGHFPGKALVPEPFFIEMIAQAGGVLYGLGLDFQKELILAKVEEARFFAQVAPPCEFTVEAEIEEEHEQGGWISGSVWLGERTVASCRLLLVKMDDLAGNGKKVVFNDGFLKYFDIENVVKRSGCPA